MAYLTRAEIVTYLLQGTPMSWNRQAKTSRLARVLSLFAALLVPTVLFAQNCALCYTQAASAGHRVIQALRSGILMLIAPPMFICIAIAIMAYRKRNQFNSVE
jgi:cytochrome bd-type quinol oxidase subunit 2